MQITPHIVVRAAAEAADWYARAFGFEEVSRLPVPDGRYMSIVLRYGDSAIHICDEFPEMGVVVKEAAGALALSTGDAAALWSRALAAGAEELQPLGEAFWGALFGRVADPYGHRWNIEQHLRDVPADEQERAVAAMFS